MCLLKALCVAIVASVIPAQIAYAASPEMASKLKDRICSLNKEQWVEQETVDREVGQTPAYDTHHAVCVLEFVTSGYWFKIEHRKSVYVSRNFGWSETKEDSLMIMVVLIECFDEQSPVQLPRWIVEDRQTKGRATFGVRDTFGPGIEGKDHFFLPSNSPELDPCIAEACDPVGEQYTLQWQDFYDHVLQQTGSYLNIPF